MVPRWFPDGRTPAFRMHENLKNPKTKFAGPCAQGVLDPVIVPRPMSHGRSVLFDLFEDNAFIGTSAHESVPLAGYSLATRRLPAGFPLWVAPQNLMRILE